MYEVVIMDLDGTVTESEPGIVKCVQYALEKMGHAPLSPAALRAFIGPPLHDSFVKIGMDAVQAQRAVDHYRERYRERGWQENALYPGIEALLRALKARGAYVALATVKPQIFAERIIDHFALTDCFDRIAGAALSDTHADKAALIKRAMRGVSGRAVMVGDRANDMEGAKAHGMAAIGAGYGYGSVQELMDAGADAVAMDVYALSRMLLGPETQGCNI